MRPIRVEDNRSTSSEQALGQSCGQADFQNSFPMAGVNPRRDTAASTVSPCTAAMLRQETQSRVHPVYGAADLNGLSWPFTQRALVRQPSVTISLAAIAVPGPSTRCPMLVKSVEINAWRAYGL